MRYCPDSVQCLSRPDDPGYRSAPTHRRAQPPDRRTRRHAPGLGAALRAAPPGADRGRLPSLWQRRRGPGAGDDGADRGGGLCGRGGAPDRVLRAGGRGRRGGATEGEPLTASVDALRVALEAFDDSGANAVLDEALSRFTLETVAEGSFCPRCERSGVAGRAARSASRRSTSRPASIRGRLLSVARNWGAGSGPPGAAGLPARTRATTSGLISFGLVLHSRGWRITYLGPDTPIDTVSHGGRRSAPGRDRARGARPDAVRVGGRASSRHWRPAGGC